jgi:hypothetical protein
MTRQTPNRVKHGPAGAVACATRAASLPLRRDSAQGGRAWTSDSGARRRSSPGRAAGSVAGSRSSPPVRDAGSRSAREARTRWRPQRPRPGRSVVRRSPSPPTSPRRTGPRRRRGRARRLRGRRRPRQQRRRLDRELVPRDEPRGLAAGHRPEPLPGRASEPAGRALDARPERRRHREHRLDLRARVGRELREAADLHRRQGGRDRDVEGARHGARPP